LQAVDGEWAGQLVGEVDLSAEAVGLRSEVVGFFPAVEAAFAEAGIGVTRKGSPELFEPVGRTGSDLPGMKSEVGNDGSGVGVRKLSDGFPVGFFRAVDHHLIDSGFVGLGENFLRFGKQVEVIVAIGQHERQGDSSSERIWTRIDRMDGIVLWDTRKGSETSYAS
jgi:hypothetical protein